MQSTVEPPNSVPQMHHKINVFSPKYSGKWGPGFDLNTSRPLYNVVFLGAYNLIALIFIIPSISLECKDYYFESQLRKLNYCGSSLKSTHFVYRNTAEYNNSLHSSV